MVRVRANMTRRVSTRSNFHYSHAFSIPRTHIPSTHICVLTDLHRSRWRLPLLESRSSIYSSHPPPFRIQSDDQGCHTSASKYSSALVELKEGRVISFSLAILCFSVIYVTPSNPELCQPYPRPSSINTNRVSVVLIVYIAA